MNDQLNAIAQTPEEHHPARRFARLLTAGFLLYTALIVLGHIIGFPLSYTYLHTVCTANCESVPILTTANVMALTRMGLSVTWYANSYTVIQTIYILACVGVAVLIVLKKPGQLVPLSVGFLLVGLSAYEGANYPALTATYPFLSMPSFVFINMIGLGAIGNYAFFAFPNGQFASRWTLWLFLFYALASVIPPINDTLSTVLDILNITSFPIIILVLIYRSRTMLNAREHNATKWIIYSLSIFTVLSLLTFGVLPAVAPPDSLWFLLINTLGFFGCGINIVGFFMAIFHANAFDIDILINRTLVYLLLTVALALIYFGSVIGLQALVYSLIGQTSSITIVVSTLLIAVLFQPFRRVIQDIIDKRFYRRKYDTSRILANFGATLRDEVELEQLSQQLVGVVRETMQPTQVTLWLCVPQENRPEGHGQDA
ncbi:hypothetical protein [Ktedonospora formicarum]|uniref:Uncharacterized protein n=1 Tax=Ktedonospora formicarum TaxID=2778364 RepID=A0A8J3IAJ6_9CHLR|nr:hypothetical protein [Ktedonospora formicarum]GHO49072.1 hypothetical protein KSX_72350 [Ktedonospora formicarum]